MVPLSHQVVNPHTPNEAQLRITKRQSSLLPKGRKVNPMRNSSKLLVAAALLAGFTVTPAFANAANTTGTFGVSATITNNCVLTPPAAVDLGAYDPTSASQVSGTGTMQVKCTKGTSYTTTLTSTNTFKLKSGTDEIPYVIYQPASDGTGATTTAWTGSAGPTVSAASNGNRSMVATIRPSIGVDVPAGSYTDTVTITVTW